MAVPTIRQLINAIQDGVMDPNQAQLLTLDPKLYATQLNQWEFEDNDKRIDKFKAMATAGFFLANEKYVLAKATDAAAATALAGDYARVICAASRIVDWARPVGATDDNYLDQIAT